jgi:hypothetical protein
VEALLRLSRMPVMLLSLLVSGLAWTVCVPDVDGMGVSSKADCNMYSSPRIVTSRIQSSQATVLGS